VHVSETLFGLEVVIRGSGARAATVGLSEPDRELADVVSALIRGAGSTGTNLQALPDLLVPVDSRELVQLRRDHLTALDRDVVRYRDERAAVDARIEMLLG